MKAQLTVIPARGRWTCARYRRPQQLFERKRDRDSVQVTSICNEWGSKNCLKAGTAQCDEEQQQVCAGAVPAQKEWSGKEMVFKSLNDLAPQYLCNLFAKNSACSSRSLRNTETDLRLPKKRSANGQKCFSFRGAKLWNSLPAAESKTASSLGSFKKSIQG